MNQNEWSSSNADNNQLVSGLNYTSNTRNQSKNNQLKSRKYSQEQNYLMNSKTDKKSNFPSNNLKKAPHIDRARKYEESNSHPHQPRKRENPKNKLQIGINLRLQKTTFGRVLSNC